MAEQTQIDFSQLEGVTPVIPTESVETITTETVQPTVDIQTTTPTKEESIIDFSQLEGVTPVTQEQPQIDFSQLEGVTEVTSLDMPTPIKTDEYSTAEKIRYGIDKQNTFFGNLYRVVKASTQAAFDPEKEFKDYIKSNFNEEQRELKQKYGNLASGAYDDDTTVQAAAMATMLVDPFYLAAYMTPWGRAATASMKGIAAISGVTVGLDKLLDNLATTGEVRPGEVAIAAGTATVLGPLSVKALRGIQSLLPNANTAQVQKIIGVVEGKKAKDLGVSLPEFKKLQAIAGDKEVLEINKQLQLAGKNWIKPIAEETKIFNASEKRIQQQIKKILGDKKQATKASFTYKDKYLKTVNDALAKKEKTLADISTEFKDKQNLLWNEISKNSKAVTDLTAKRDYTMLKKLKETKSFTRNAAEAVISASIRPAMGAGIGYTFGRLWGEDDANLNNWVMVGAALGGLNKLVQRSGTVFATGEKNLLENIIYNNATRNAFQKVRELTATTTSTKLKALGGETEKIGMKLFQELDSPVTKFSASGIADKIKQDYSNRAFELIKNTTADEQRAAVRVARGSKESVSGKVNTLAKNIRTFLDDFRNEYTSVGIGLRKDITKNGVTVGTKRIDPIKDYFPRVWAWDIIEKDPEKFQKVIASIFKSQGKKKPEDSARSFYNSLATANDQGFYNKEAVNELVNNLIGKSKKSFTKPIIRGLPLSDHIAQDRVLKGSYGQVEKVLEKNGYLVDDIPSILNNLITTSADSIGFAKNFGAKGELLQPYIKGIVDKYAGQANAAQLASNEIGLVMKSIDGFFGRYGQARQGIVKSGAGILSTISNLNMLDRVTIASLGDLVQPFTNSNNFRSWIQGLKETALTSKGESGLAKNLGYAQSKEIQQSLLKTITPLDDATNAAQVMGASGTVRKLNELGFKAMGLQWLTGFARRYAYNTGAVDAYTSARKLATYASRGNSLSSTKGLKLVQDVSKYGINTTDALKLGKEISYDAAKKSKIGKKVLNDAGIIASNRDALIPQVSNRLLFTQSRDPLVRLMGQFMSWTLAKSAQTNKLLQRIENGDTKQLVKLLAGLPVYGGIQSLREIAKHGEVQTDLETQTDKWYSEAVRLSGVAGTAPELVIGRLTGPGARQPWYLFAPFFSILNETGNIAKETYKGNTDKAMEIFSEKIAPLPTWRRWVMKLFPESEFTTPVSETKVSDRLKFATGDVVDVDNPMVDVAIDEANKSSKEEAAEEQAMLPPEKPIKSQMDKLMIPKEKPTIVKEDVVYSLPKNVDMKFLEEVEGNKNEMYVPKNKQGIALGKSGPTIGMGFDVGGRNENDLKGLPPEIIKKLKPYLGLRKQEAIDFIEKNPLVITDKEKVIINAFAKKDEMEKLRKKWKETTGKSFDDLDTKAATTIASVAFQNGDLSRKAPKFWKQVTNEDWSGAFYNLLDWDDTGKPSQTQTRREKEAKLLKGLFKGDK
jgi:GH24 family phage-related lysozyme (muramidase)